jgi:hypothetical protein
LALFLMMRGHVLKDNGLLRDAQVAYAVANQLWPQSRTTAYWLVTVVDRQFHLSEVAAAPQQQFAPEWWKSPAAIEANRLQVERINAENRRLMEAQQQRQAVPPPPGKANVNQQSGYPSPYGTR